MIKNILVGYSGERGSQVALGVAIGLTRATQGRLHVMAVESVGEDVRPPVSEAIGEGQIAPMPDTVAEPLASDEPPPAILDRVAEQCQEQGVFCSLQHRFGDPAARLSEMARVMDLTVAGRHDEGVAPLGRPLGRVARQLATRMPGPLLLTAPGHEASRGLTLLYEPSAPGGRALSLAAELAHLQNLSLNVMCLGHEGVEPAQAAAEVRFALRAYHVEGDILQAGGTGDALQNAILTWQDGLMVLPAPPKRWLSRPLDALRPAFTLAATHVLMVP